MWLKTEYFSSAFPISNAVGRLRKFYLIPRNVPTTNTPRNICKLQNYTDFVTVYDEDDNTELYTLISNISLPRSALIGAHTINTNYTSKWSNGDDVTFTQLNETCNEICGAAFRANGSWELLPYSTTIYFICYEEGVGQASDKYILILLNKNWTEAQLYCRNNHNDLVSIRNETENERVKSIIKDSEFNFWIGLLYDNIEWSDGAQSSYRNYSKIPDQEKQTLLTINNSKKTWIQVSKTGSYNALCYKSFIHVSSDEMSWEDAQNYCNSNASGLLQIESQNDQIETERELRRQKIPGPVWIGLRYKFTSGLWIWANGSFVESWINWKGGSQPEHQMSQYCGAIEKVNGVFKLSDKDCGSKFRVVCEKI
nr:macrophage mannose receptor 1-like [Misgurnus anguillicaudatus]